MNKKSIMRRVYAVWVARQIASPFSVKLLALCAFLYGLHVSASVKDVLHNSPSFFDLHSTAQFFTSAFVNTDAVTQIFTASIIALIVWFGRDAAKKFAIANRYTALRSIVGI
jgi:hypothetical protein